MEMKELYELIEGIGCLTFSTFSEQGEIHSRIAHFNGYDQEGLYFRTMKTKPYFRQLMKTNKLTVCGMSNNRILGHQEDGTPLFPPSYSLRLIGDIKHVNDEVIIEKSKTNSLLLTAVQDMKKYPTMKGANFIMYRAKGEIFDVDFELSQRDHKLLRSRFSFGGVDYNEAGPHITKQCIECGQCFEICTFDAIEKGSSYKVNHRFCDDCGMCGLVCPIDAIEESLEF